MAVIPTQPGKTPVPGQSMVSGQSIPGTTPPAIQATPPAPAPTSFRTVAAPASTNLEPNVPLAPPSKGEYAWSSETGWSYEGKPSSPPPEREEPTTPVATTAPAKAPVSASAVKAPVTPAPPSPAAKAAPAKVPLQDSDALHTMLRGGASAYQAMNFWLSQGHSLADIDPNSSVGVMLGRMGTDTVANAVQQVQQTKLSTQWSVLTASQRQQALVDPNSTFYNKSIATAQRNVNAFATANNISPTDYTALLAHGLPKIALDLAYPGNEALFGALQVWNTTSDKQKMQMLTDPTNPLYNKSVADAQQKVYSFAAAKGLGGIDTLTLIAHGIDVNILKQAYPGNDARFDQLQVLASVSKYWTPDGYSLSQYFRDIANQGLVKAQIARGNYTALDTAQRKLVTAGFDASVVAQNRATALSGGQVIGGPTTPRPNVIETAQMGFGAWTQQYQKDWISSINNMSIPDRAKDILKELGGATGAAIAMIPAAILAIGGAVTRPSSALGTLKGMGTGIIESAKVLLPGSQADPYTVGAAAFNTIMLIEGGRSFPKVTGALINRLRSDVITGNALAHTADVGREIIAKGISKLTARQLVQDIETLQLGGEIPAARLRSLRGTSIGTAMVNRIPGGTVDIVLKSADGSIVGYVSGMQRVVADTTYHATPNINSLIEQLKTKGYIEIQVPGDRPGLFVSQQLAQTFLYDNRGTPSPGALAIKVTSKDLMSPPLEVLDSPTLAIMRNKMFALDRAGELLKDKVYTLFKGYGEPTHLEYELYVPQGTKLYSLGDNLTKTYTTSLVGFDAPEGGGVALRPGQTIPMYWVGTKSAIEAGLTAPTIAEVYTAKLLGDLTTIRQYAPWNLRLRKVELAEKGVYAGGPFASVIRQINLKVVPEDVGAGRVSALVHNTEGHILLTRTLGQDRFDLPGGGVTMKETIAGGMSRELYEETGMKPSYLDHVDTFESSFNPRGSKQKFQIFETTTKEAMGPIEGSEVAEYLWWDGKSELKYPVAEFAKDAIARQRAFGAVSDVKAVSQAIKEAGSDIKKLDELSKESSKFVAEALDDAYLKGYLPWRPSAVKIVPLSPQIVAQEQSTESRLGAVIEPQLIKVVEIPRGVAAAEPKESVAGEVVLVKKTIEGAIAEERPREGGVERPVKRVATKESLGEREAERATEAKAVEGVGAIEQPMKRVPERPLEKAGVVEIRTIEQPTERAPGKPPERLPDQPLTIPPPERPLESPPSTPPPPPSLVRSKERVFEEGKQQEVLRELFKGGVAWKQGIVYWVGKVPFSTIEDWRAFSRRNLPSDVKIVSGGPRSAYASIQAMGYKVPESMTLKLGFQKVTVSAPSVAPGREGAIGFENVAGTQPPVDVILKYREPGAFRDVETSFRQKLSREKATPEVAQAGMEKAEVASAGHATKGIEHQKETTKEVVAVTPEVISFRQGTDTGYPGAFRDPNAFRETAAPTIGAPEQGAFDVSNWLFGKPERRKILPKKSKKSREGRASSMMMSVRW